MLTFCFKCLGCAYEFEVQHKISEPHPDKCPKCKKKMLQQIFTVPSFSFKGNGWSSYGKSGEKSQK